MSLLKFSITVLAVFISLSGVSQIYFNNALDTYSNWEFFSGIVEVGDGYIVGGSVPDSSTGAGQKAMIQKLDLTGNVIWEKDYGNYWENHYIASNESFLEVTDGYLLAGTFQDSVSTDAFLMRFDLNGDTLWYNRYNFGLPTNIYTAKETTDKGIIAVGTLDGANMQDLVFKTDSLGNLEWFNSFGSSSYHESLSSVDLAENGNYILGGIKVTFTDVASYAHVVKIDSLGNPLWEDNVQTGSHEPYDGWGAHVTTTMDGNYLVASGYTNSYNVWPTSEGFLYKLNTSGTTVWSNTYGPERILTRFNVAIELPDSSIVLSGTTQYVGTPDRFVSWLLKVNAQGDSIWDRRYEYDANFASSGQNYSLDLISTSDGGFATVGFLIIGPSGTQDGWAVKMDSMGCLFSGCDTLVGIIEVNIENQWAISVYPNPTSEYINIAGNFPTPSELQLFSTSGELMFEQIIHDLPFKIDVKEFPGGSFFYSISDDKGFNKTGEIIISDH